MFIVWWVFGLWGNVNVSTHSNKIYSNKVTTPALWWWRVIPPSNFNFNTNVYQKPYMSWLNENPIHTNEYEYRKILIMPLSVCFVNQLISLITPVSCLHQKMVAGRWHIWTFLTTWTTDVDTPSGICYDTCGTPSRETYSHPRRLKRRRLCEQSSSISGTARRHQTPYQCSVSRAGWLQ